MEALPVTPVIGEAVVVSVETPVLESESVPFVPINVHVGWPTIRVLGSGPIDGGDVGKKECVLLSAAAYAVRVDGTATIAGRAEGPGQIGRTRVVVQPKSRAT